MAGGLLFGTAFLMKQQGVFLPGFGALMVLIHYAGLRPFAWRKVLVGSVVFTMGVVLPYAATCAWLWHAGVFNQFWFWTVLYARQYVQMVPMLEGVKTFGEQFREIAGATWPLWIAALLGALLIGRAKDAAKVRWFLYAYFVFSFLCVCPGLYFREHYFIVWLPAVAIFSGVACSRLLYVSARWQGASRRMEGGGQGPLRHPQHKPAKWRLLTLVQFASAVSGIVLWLAIILLLTAATFMLWQQREVFILWTPTQACREIYGANPFVESPVIADYLRRHSTPDQQVAVIGSEPQLYFYAKRKSATGYIYVYGLMESQPFAQKMQEEMCREIERAKPEFIVLVNNTCSWGTDPGPYSFVWQWANNYMNSNYECVGLVDEVSPDQTDYFWDDQAIDAVPHSSENVWIVRRRNDVQRALAEAASLRVPLTGPVLGASTPTFPFLPWAAAAPASITVSFFRAICRFPAKASPPLKNIRATPIWTRNRRAKWQVVIHLVKMGRGPLGV